MKVHALEGHETKYYGGIERPKMLMVKPVCGRWMWAEDVTLSADPAAVTCDRCREILAGGIEMPNQEPGRREAEE